MKTATIVIVGAGKIGRGFLAHLIYESGHPFTFIEHYDEIVQQLQVRRRYRVEIVGNPDRSATITDFDIVGWRDEGAAQACLDADTIFTAVGGARVAALGPQLAPLLATRWRHRPEAPLNIVTCENWVHPATLLQNAILAHLPTALREHAHELLGVADATVLRSCMEPTPEQAAEDPWTVQAQDYWELQIDGDALKAPLPAVPGLQPVPQFQRALERKLYTYNAASATMSFLGTLVGYRYLHEAAHDQRILAITRAVLREAGTAVCRRYGYTEEAQRNFAESALAKYRNLQIPDTLERNVRDPLRKLGRSDRLVGAACLCLDVGVIPSALALAIAAGLRYQEPTDPSARALQEQLAEQGIDHVLATVCGLDPQGDLAQMIKRRGVDVDRFVRGEVVEG